MEFGRMTVSNNGYNVDSKNKNVYITQLELSIEDNDYVRYWFSSFISVFIKTGYMI